MNTYMVIQALKKTLRSCVMSYKYAIRNQLPCMVLHSLCDFVSLEIKKSFDFSFVDV